MFFNQLKISFKKLFSVNKQEKTQNYPNTLVIGRDQHNVSRKQISSAALKVLYGLKNAGYSSHLVGGGVRDLLLGLAPKDFDIATDAHPEQIYKLFRNSRLIGRRFRLAHIFFGAEIIEVSTFRAAANIEFHHSKEGMILRDNVYGSIEEDALRRDFTVNAIYYNVNDFSLLDFTGGMADLQAKQIRVIGEPTTRYREDPVRMLRAVRLATRLGFSIEAESAAAIHAMATIITQVSEARLFEECTKMLLKGCARNTYQALQEFGLIKELFPLLIESGSDAVGRNIIEHTLQSTDERYANDKTISAPFFYAALLWSSVAKAQTNFIALGQGTYFALEAAMNQVIEQQQLTLAIPRRITLVMRDIWRFQTRLETQRLKKAITLANHPRFRAAYDLLLLRALSQDQVAIPLADWWRQFIQLDVEQKMTMILDLRAMSNKKRPKHKKPVQDHKK